MNTKYTKYEILPKVTETRKGHGISNKTFFFVKKFYFHVLYSKVWLKREHEAAESACDYGLRVSWKIEKVPWKSHGFFQLYTCMNPGILWTRGLGSSGQWGVVAKEYRSIYVNLLSLVVAVQTSESGLEGDSNSHPFPPLFSLPAFFSSFFKKYFFCICFVIFGVFSPSFATIFLAFLKKPSVENGQCVHRLFTVQ